MSAPSHGTPGSNVLIDPGRQAVASQWKTGKPLSAHAKVRNLLSGLLSLAGQMSFLLDVSPSLSFQTVFLVQESTELLHIAMESQKQGKKSLVPVAASYTHPPAELHTGNSHAPASGQFRRNSKVRDSPKDNETTPSSSRI